MQATFMLECLCMLNVDKAAFMLACLCMFNVDKAEFMLACLCMLSVGIGYIHTRMSVYVECRYRLHSCYYVCVRSV